MRNRNTLTEQTASGTVPIYRVPNLSSNCYGTVTAIEYCYRYTGSSLATFNWTVLILEDNGSNFMLNRTYIIHSSMDSANCTSNTGQVTVCCDMTNIESFDLPMSFTFGMIESAQGNTPGTTLLGYPYSPEYGVNAVVVTKGEVTLSAGSTIRSRPAGPIGIRMLWFVIGKYK